MDASANGLQAGDVAAHLDRGHEHIQFMFEDSITDGLRELMHVQRG
jgi:hypothetical protein